MFLLCGYGKRDYCGSSVVLLIYDICAVYAYVIGNMDVKSVDTLNYLLFHLRLRFPTFRPPLRLKSFCDMFSEGFKRGGDVLPFFAFLNSLLQGFFCFEI